MSFSLKFKVFFGVAFSFLMVAGILTSLNRAPAGFSYQPNVAKAAGGEGTSQTDRHNGGWP